MARTPFQFCDNEARFMGHGLLPPTNASAPTWQVSHECHFTLVVITGLEGNMIVKALHTQVPNLLKHMRMLPSWRRATIECISLPAASNAAELHADECTTHQNDGDG
jgi:hypothetical protein